MEYHNTFPGDGIVLLSKKCQVTDKRHSLLKVTTYTSNDASDAKNVNLNSGLTKIQLAPKFTKFSQQRLQNVRCHLNADSFGLWNVRRFE